MRLPFPSGPPPGMRRHRTQSAPDAAFALLTFGKTPGFSGLSFLVCKGSTRTSQTDPCQRQRPWERLATGGHGGQRTSRAGKGSEGWALRVVSRRGLTVHSHPVETGQPFSPSLCSRSQGRGMRKEADEKNNETRYFMGIQCLLTHMSPVPQCLAPKHNAKGLCKTHSISLLYTYF